MPDFGPPARRVTARRLTRDGVEGASETRYVPEEVPIALSYDGEPFAVLMATPGDIEDLAYGFSLTEGIVRTPDDISGLSKEVTPEGILVDLSLTKTARAARLLGRRRNIEGRSSCGICGIEQIHDAVRPLAPVSGRIALHITAVTRALDALDANQALNLETHAVHGAAFANTAGDIVALREDVGRHNALDKLIGALMREGVDRGQGFCIITSRCSYEMVDKATQAGILALVAISAPTALALRKAREAQLTLVALARRDGALLFEDPKGLLTGII